MDSEIDETGDLIACLSGSFTDRKIISTQVCLRVGTGIFSGKFFPCFVDSDDDLCWLLSLSVSFFEILGRKFVRWFSFSLQGGLVLFLDTHWGSFL